MNLNELRPAKGSKRARKRIGRGHGTGWGKTAGKGHNGQKQRSGSYISPIFEGGQMPVVRRVPKRGFSNSPFKRDIEVVSLDRIIEKFADGEVVSIETLVDKKVVKNPGFRVRRSSDENEKIYSTELKIIGDAEVTSKYTVKTHKISKKAQELIEKAGGTVEILESQSFSNKAGNNKKSDNE